MVEDIVRRKGYLTLGSRLKRIGDRLQAEVQQIIDARGMPLQASHYPLLGALDEHGPLSIGDLANALGVSQPGVTRAVAHLARAGVVSVRRGKVDQRTRTVTLTDLGARLVLDSRQTVWPQIERCLEEIMAGQSGSLLDRLDLVEDALRERSFMQRISAAKGPGNHG